ncbi:MAG: arcB [Bacteroidetes bacterium]|nr:arcB [Bacteroidota bacterium]
MKLTIELKIAAGFLLSLLIIVMFSINTFFNMRGLIKENKQQEEARLVISSVDSIKYQLIKAEASGRKYALSGNEKDHAVYAAAIKKATVYINTLAGTLLQDKKYTQQKVQLQQAFLGMVAFGDKVIETRHLKGTAAAIELVLNGKLAEQGNDILSNLQQIEQQQRDTINHLAENNMTEANDTILSFLLLIAAIFIILVVLYFLFRKDLALRRQAERDLLKLNEELESRVKKRTEELEENEKKLEYKVNQLNAFMYQASHDLRSPLVSLKGLIEVAENEVGNNPVLKEYFRMIDKSTGNMEKLLLDLVSITNLAQGSLTSNRICFNEMIAGVLDSLKHYPDFNKIVISKDIHEDIPFYNDDKLLHSVLQNLIDNAVKYRKVDAARSSEIKITIETNRQSVIINISDNGIGIPAKAQEKVFEMFYRATSAASGSGLGLHIVKTSVEKMGGKITLRSSETGGTSVYVTLPNLQK